MCSYRWDKLINPAKWICKFATVCFNTWQSCSAQQRNQKGRAKACESYEEIPFTFWFWNFSPGIPLKLDANCGSLSCHLQNSLQETWENNNGWRKYQDLKTFKEFPTFTSQGSANFQSGFSPKHCGHKIWQWTKGAFFDRKHWIPQEIIDPSTAAYTPPHWSNPTKCCSEYMNLNHWLRGQNALSHLSGESPQIPVMQRDSAQTLHATFGHDWIAAAQLTKNEPQTSKHIL